MESSRGLGLPWLPPKPFWYNQSLFKSHRSCLSISNAEWCLSASTSSSSLDSWSDSEPPVFLPAHDLAYTAFFFAALSGGMELLRQPQPLSETTHEQKIISGFKLYKDVLNISTIEMRHSPRLHAQMEEIDMHLRLACPALPPTRTYYDSSWRMTHHQASCSTVATCMCPGCANQSKAQTINTKTPPPWG